MFNLLIFGFIASNLAFLHGLVIDFKDLATNYSLHLTTSSITGKINPGLILAGIDVEANFTINTITSVAGIVYTTDILPVAINVELAPTAEVAESLPITTIYGNGFVAKKGDLGVFVEFTPEIILKSTGNTTDITAEGFILSSYALKSRYWDMFVSGFKFSQVFIKTPEYSSLETNWYAKSKHASNFLCSNSTLHFADTQMVFRDLRVTANLNANDINSVYAVCPQDCKLGDLDCLRKGDNCTIVNGECPKYTLPSIPVESSAASTYKNFILSFLSLIYFILLCDHF
uniref:Uncharacterized protein n=1 Tax=Ditylenchus dipsaci TaxID=166011 RepID=A0A915D999_9BILA